MLYKHTKCSPLDNIGVLKAEIIQVYKGTTGTHFGRVNNVLLVSILERSSVRIKKRRLRDKQLIPGVIATTRTCVKRTSGLCLFFKKNAFITALDLDSYQGIYVKKPMVKEIKKNFKLDKMLKVCKSSRFF